MEAFVPVVGYEDRYMIGTKGNVVSLLTREYLSIQIGKRGYPVIKLSKNGKKKQVTVHKRLFNIIRYEN